MSYSRFPAYIWVGSFCPDDCPSMLPCPDCKQTAGGYICHSGNHPICNDPAHEVIHLWIKKAASAEEGFGVLNAPEDYDVQGGITIPVEFFDQLVLCRYAELERDGLLEATRARLKDDSSPFNGNFGSFTALEAMGEDPVGDMKKKWEDQGIRNE